MDPTPPAPLIRRQTTQSIRIASESDTQEVPSSAPEALSPRLRASNSRVRLESVIDTSKSAEVTPQSLPEDSDTAAATAALSPRMRAAQSRSRLESVIDTSSPATPQAESATAESAVVSPRERASNARVRLESVIDSAAKPATEEPPKRSISIWRLFSSRKNLNEEANTTPAPPAAPASPQPKEPEVKEEIVDNTFYSSSVAPGPFAPRLDETPLSPRSALKKRGENSSNALLASHTQTAIAKAAAVQEQKQAKAAAKANAKAGKSVKFGTEPNKKSREPSLPYSPSSQTMHNLFANGSGPDNSDADSAPVATKTPTLSSLASSAAQQSLSPRKTPTPVTAAAATPAATPLSPRSSPLSPRSSPLSPRLQAIGASMKNLFSQTEEQKRAKEEKKRQKEEEKRRKAEEKAKEKARKEAEKQAKKQEEERKKAQKAEEVRLKQLMEQRGRSFSKIDTKNPSAVMERMPSNRILARLIPDDKGKVSEIENTEGKKEDMPMRVRPLSPRGEPVPTEEKQGLLSRMLAKAPSFSNLKREGSRAKLWEDVLSGRKTKGDVTGRRAVSAPPRPPPLPSAPLGDHTRLYTSFYTESSLPHTLLGESLPKFSFPALAPRAQAARGSSVARGNRAELDLPTLSQRTLRSAMLTNSSNPYRALLSEDASREDFIVADVMRSLVNSVIEEANKPEVKEETNPLTLVGAYSKSLLQTLLQPFVPLAVPAPKLSEADLMIEGQVKAVMVDLVAKVEARAKLDERRAQASVADVLKQQALKEQRRIEEYMSAINAREMDFANARASAYMAEQAHSQDAKDKRARIEERLRIRTKVEQKQTEEVQALVHLAETYHAKALQAEKERQLRNEMKQQERVYAAKAMHLYRMKELEPFVKQAEEAVLSKRDTIFKDEQELKKQQRIARAVALAQNIKAQADIRASISTGANLQTQVAAVENKVLEEEHNLVEHEAEVLKLHHELDMLAAEESETDYDAQRRLGRPLSLREKQDKAERSVARERARAKARQRLAEIEETQLRKRLEEARIEEQRRVKREEDALHALNKRRMEEAVVRRREEEKRKVEEQRRTAEEAEIRKLMDDMVWEVSADERIEAEVSRVLDRVVRKVERRDEHRQVAETLEDIVAVVEEIDNMRQVFRCVTDLKDEVEARIEVEEALNDIVFELQAEECLNELVDDLARETARQSLRAEKKEFKVVKEVMDFMLHEVQVTHDIEQAIDELKLRRKTRIRMQTRRRVKVQSAAWLERARSTLEQRRIDEENIERTRRMLEEKVRQKREEEKQKELQRQRDEQERKDREERERLEKERRELEEKLEKERKVREAQERVERERREKEDSERFRQLELQRQRDEADRLVQHSVRSAMELMVRAAEIEYEEFQTLSLRQKHSLYPAKFPKPAKTEADSSDAFVPPKSQATKVPAQKSFFSRVPLLGALMESDKETEKEQDKEEKKAAEPVLDNPVIEEYPLTNSKTLRIGFQSAMSVPDLGDEEEAGDSSGQQTKEREAQIAKELAEQRQRQREEEERSQKLAAENERRVREEASRKEIKKSISKAEEEKARYDEVLRTMQKASVGQAGVADLLKGTDASMDSNDFDSFETAPPPQRTRAASVVTTQEPIGFARLPNRGRSRTEDDPNCVVM